MTGYRIVRTKLQRLTATTLPHYRQQPTALELLRVDARQRHYSEPIVAGRWRQRRNS